MKQDFAYNSEELCDIFVCSKFSFSGYELVIQNTSHMMEAMIFLKYYIVISLMVFVYLKQNS